AELDRFSPRDRLEQAGTCPPDLGFLDGVDHPRSYWAELQLDGHIAPVPGEFVTAVGQGGGPLSGFLCVPEQEGHVLPPPPRPAGTAPNPALRGATPSAERYENPPA